MSIGVAQEKIEQTLALRNAILASAAEISDFKNYSIPELIQEVQPKPTNLLKEHRDLWLKLIGFVAACSKITNSNKGELP
jgi:hypothetical protein